MQYKAIWFRRKFEFNLPGELFPMLTERMRGAIIRIEDKLRDVPEKILLTKTEGWTIKEHVGHLHVVEELWFKRIENYKNNDEHLFPADLENSKTKEADFNDQSIVFLLDNFAQSRIELVRQFDSFGEDEVEKVSHHPRLGTPMRLIDLAYFIAEHDDHHLTKIHDIVELNKK